MAPRNHVLDGVEIATGRGNFGGVWPTEKDWQFLLRCVQKNESFNPK